MKKSLKGQVYYTAEKTFKGYPFKAFRIADCEGSQPLHCHDYMQIWYVKSGECIHWFNGIEYKLTKGNIFILPPDVTHRIMSLDMDTELFGCEFLESFICDSEGDKVSFDFNYIKPFLVSKDKVKPIFTLDGAVIKNIEALFEDLVFEYKQKKSFFELSIKAIILRILSIVAREYEGKLKITQKNILKRHQRVMTDVLHYIDKNYNKKIFLSEVCDIAFMAPTYFSCIFKQMVGRTFRDYVNYLRVTKAKELLADYEKPISSIALEVGFGDVAYFVRIFKNETGMSPGNYRKIL